MDLLCSHKSCLQLFFSGPVCLLISIALPTPQRIPRSLISNVREVWQDAPKTLNFRKQELSWFCTEAERMACSVSPFHSWLLGSSATFFGHGRFMGSFSLAARNHMIFHSLLLCIISSYTQNENQFMGGDIEILPYSFLFSPPSPLSWLLTQ